MQQVIILGFCFLCDILIEEWCICISDVDVRDPDEKSIMTYVAQFLQYSKDASVSDEEMQVSHTHTHARTHARTYTHTHTLILIQRFCPSEPFLLVSKYYTLKYEQLSQKMKFCHHVFTLILELFLQEFLQDQSFFFIALILLIAFHKSRILGFYYTAYVGTFLYLSYS